MTRDEIMKWLEEHIFIGNRREMLCSTDFITHYRDVYNNGDVYEYKSEHATLWHEHCTTWINGRVVDCADYEWFGFGWRRLEV